MGNGTKALIVEHKLAVAILLLLLTTLLAAVPTASILESRITFVETTNGQHEERIKNVEAHVAADEQSSKEVNRRLDRIEVKLDRLLERD